jgi:hypothetical protein
LFLCGLIAPDASSSGGRLAECEAVS